MKTGQPQDTPAKLLGYPAQEFVFHGLRDPLPTGRYPDQKVWVRRAPCLQKGEGVPEMGAKPLKALRGYRAFNRGSENH